MSLRGRPSRSIALARHDQRVRRVEAAADADDGLRARRSRRAAARGRRPGCCRPRSSPARAARGRRARTGSGRPCAAGRCRPPAGRASNSTVAEAVGPLVVRAAVVVERALPQALLAQPVEVDVGDRAARPVGEALGLGEQVAALVDHRLAVPGQVGRRLALAGRGIDVRREAPRAALRTSSRRSSARATVIGLPLRLTSTVAPASAASRARRDRHPHVLADLDVQDEARDVEAPEEQVGTEGRPRRRRPSMSLAVAGRRRARTSGARRTRGSWAGRTSARRRAPRRGGSRRRSCRAVAVTQRGADDEHRAAARRLPRRSRRSPSSTRVEHGVLQERGRRSQ